jgi:hypothetical protein
VKGEYYLLCPPPAELIVQKVACPLRANAYGGPGAELNKFLNEL